MLDKAQQVELLSMARDAITAEMSGHHELIQPASNNHDDWLQQPAACFVTLKINDKLRGCIGCLEAEKPLAQVVADYAVAAAFHDHRFPPLNRAQLALVHIEISLLSPMVLIAFSDEQDLLQQLRVDEDGLLLEFGSYRATFLPQVWQQLPDKAEFLAHLKQKAGLEADFWDDGICCSRYSVDHFSEALR